jgi:hypothetical protein
MMVPWELPYDFQVSDENGNALERTPVDGNGRCRVALASGLGKGATIVVTGKYMGPSPRHRARVDLPRAVGLLEQRCKLTVHADETTELLVGPAGMEEAVPEKHRYQIVTSDTPSFVDIAWRPYRPDFAVHAVVDIFVRGVRAQVREKLTFGAPPSTALPLDPGGAIQLNVPREIKSLVQIRPPLPSEPLQPENGTVWVKPSGDEPREVVLEYELSLSDPESGEGELAARRLEVGMVWPRSTTHRSAKVRVWCDPGARVRLGNTGTLSKLWEDRGTEPVAGQDLLPSLVLKAESPQLPLVLQVEDIKGHGGPAVTCDRVLIQAQALDDEGLRCRARYFVTRANTDALEIQLPYPVDRSQLQIRVANHGVAWEPVSDAPHVARVPLSGLTGKQAFVLEVKYKLPQASGLGVTTITPPIIRGPVYYGSIRWQLGTAPDTIGFPLSLGAKVDYRWESRGWLIGPEPSVTSAELESWFTQEPAEPSPVGGVSFSNRSDDPQRVYSAQRWRWMAACSGTFTAIFLALYFLGLSRGGVVCVLLLFGAGTITLGFVWPVAFAALAYGCEPALVVISVLLLTLWLRQERYRRQLVFIPGFSRSKLDSSLLRRDSGRHSRESSTVDAPAGSGGGARGTLSSKS